MSIASVVLIIGAFFYGKSIGWDSAVLEQKEAVEELQRLSSEQADKILQLSKNQRVKTEYKVRKVYVEKDNTSCGCADKPALSGLLDELRPSKD